MYHSSESKHLCDHNNRKMVRLEHIPPPLFKYCLCPLLEQYCSIYSPALFCLTEKKYLKTIPACCFFLIMTKLLRYMYCTAFPLYWSFMNQIPGMYSKVFTNNLTIYTLFMCCACTILRGNLSLNIKSE